MKAKKLIQGKVMTSTIAKNILLTISDNPSHLFGLRFVSHFFQNKQDMHLNLLYITPNLQSESSFLLDSQHPRIKISELALKNAANRLKLAGFSEDKITTKQILKKTNTANDIIRHAEKELFDAVVVGRRGISRLEELLEDSVSINALKGVRAVPLWICRSIEPDRCNFLLCTDGSKHSERIADHAGFMLAKEKHEITILHIQAKKGPDSEVVMQKTKDILTENEIDPHRIIETVVPATNVVQTILNYAEKGIYAAVGVGYSGESHESGKFKQIFSFGSVSKKLAYHLNSASLWVA